jgi:hypothetical protein
MKNLVIKTVKIFPLMLGCLGISLPAAMLQTELAIADDLSPIISETTPSNLTASESSKPASNSLDPDRQQLLQQIQKTRQPKGF